MGMWRTCLRKDLGDGENEPLDPALPEASQSTLESSMMQGNKLTFYLYHFLSLATRSPTERSLYGGAGLPGDKSRQAVAMSIGFTAVFLRTEEASNNCLLSE